MSEFPIESHVRAGGGEIHYRDWGGSGRAVALVHGLASNCRIWDFVAPILSRRFRVVALDQRGHGRSFKPDGGYDFASVVADLDAFSDAVGLSRPVIAGHSWGADVALEYAVAHPRKTGGLVFVDGGSIEISRRSDWTLEDAKREMAPPIWTGVSETSFRKRVRTRWLDMISDPRVEDIVMANFVTLEDGTIASRLSRANHLRIIEALWDHKPSELYARVECPVLLMPARMGGADGARQSSRRFSREESIARAESLLPISETVWMENSVHDVPLQRPEAVAASIADRIASGFFG